MCAGSPVGDQDVVRGQHDVSKCTVLVKFVIGMHPLCKLKAAMPGVLPAGPRWAAMIRPGFTFQEAGPGMGPMWPPGEESPWLWSKTGPGSLEVFRLRARPLCGQWLPLEPFHASEICKGKQSDGEMSALYFCPYSVAQIWFVKALANWLLPVILSGWGSLVPFHRSGK